MSSSQRIFPNQLQLELKEKYFSLSGDSFQIKTCDTKQEIFHVKGHAFSLKESKTLFDAKGTPIFKLQENIISLRDRMHIINAETGHKEYTLRKKGIIPYLGTGTVQVWRGEKSDGKPYLEIKGNILKKNFVIKNAESGQSIGRVQRKIFNFKNLLLDRDTYILTIEPGADAALLTTLAIALDEHYHD